MEKDVDTPLLARFCLRGKNEKTQMYLPSLVPKHFDFLKLIIVLLLYKTKAKNRKKEKNEPTEIEKDARMKFG
jgi:hypothetical protein